MLGNKNQWETDNLTFDYSYPLTKHFITRHLNKGADINGNNSYNGKSLLTIVSEGYINQGHYSLDTVHYLLAKGANPFLKDGNENSMLSIAVKNGNVRLLKIIMERVDSIRDASIVYKLKNAVVIEILKQSSLGEILDLLPSSGINPNYKIPEMGGKTLMHIAAELGHIKHFLALFEMHGRVDIKDDYGNTPLDIVVSGINENFSDTSKITDQQSITTVDSLKDAAITTKNQRLYNQNATNKLVLLCCTHKVKHGRVNKLVSKGAGINGIYKNSVRNSIHNGESPLTKLVGRFVRSECEPYRTQILSYIRTIIKCGGDPSKTDAFGDSAISLAYAKDDERLLKVLVKIYVSPQTNISVDNVEQPSTSRGHGGK